MANRLTKNEKNILYSKLSELGSSVSKTEAMDICRPFHDLLYDEEKAKEQALGRMAVRILKNYHRDEHNMPAFYNYKDEEGNSMYANIDKTEDVKVLEQVNRQMTKQATAIARTRRKVNRRWLEVSGQLTLEEVGGER